MKSYVLPLADPDADLETVGGKGASLATLIRARFHVPEGFHITTEAYRRFVAANRLQPGIESALSSMDLSRPAELDAAARRIGELFSEAAIPADLKSEILAAYAELSGQQPAAVAVRSSATAEDLPDASFAGQQETFLNVRGGEQLLIAVRKCWASLWTARAIAYRARQNIPPQEVALAVVVQHMVPAEAAGILFTLNPLNGRRDEIVINAAWGLGEAVVGGAVTPDTIVVEKKTGKILRRETSEKRVMTVQDEAGTRESTVPEAMKNLPALSDQQAGELAGIAEQIEELFGQPVDIEWALAGGEFAILQARPVTALPEPPVEWPRRDPKGVYMRGSVVDLMPNPLSPLFATFGIGALRQQMDLLSLKITGSRAYLSEEYFTTINQYAYMNAHLPPRAMWWTFTRLLPSYPRLFRIMIPLWRDEMHPEYQAYVAGLKDLNPSAMSESQLWKQAQEIMAQIAVYVDVLMFSTMGASAGSEMLLTRVYNRLAKREGDPDAPVLLMGWDSIPIRAEKSLYDLAMWIRQNEDLARFLLDTPSTQLAARIPPLPLFESDEVRLEHTAIPGWEEFIACFHAHLRQFGHAVYQLDFAEPLPLEDPTPLLETIKMYLRGEGANPHERQRASEQKRIQTAESVLARLRGFKRWAFRNALKWGQSMASIREDALAEIGLGYPYLHRFLRELGSRLAAKGVIERADDIYMLHQDEVEAVIGGKTADLKDRVSERKAFLARMQKQIAPPMIPVKERVWGVKVDVFVTRGNEFHTENVIKGVPASAGKATAPACVLLGPEDFDQMRPGNVLVAGATTPAWTPLFAMASAVVTDIGGPLSHGSIVAREYGIPAVMGTGVATKRICSGQLITVDGSAGTVTLL